MPITSSHFGRTKNLSEREKEKLAVILSELERRGLTEEAQRAVIQATQARKIFHVDSNGYFVKDDGRQFDPTVGDCEAFIKSTAYFCALTSSRGGGKTASGAQKACLKIKDGQSGAVINPEFENFKDSTWPEFRSWLPWDAVIPRHQYMAEAGWQPTRPFSITFNNGASVRCKGLKDPEGARGPNINWFWYDEAGSDRDGMAWIIAIASVRVGYNPQAWITTTPKGKLHWIYKFFFKKEISEDIMKMLEENLKGRELIETFTTSMEENKGNLDPAFMAAMHMAYAGHKDLFRQEILGEFITPGGALGDRNWFKGKYLEKAPEKVKTRIRYYDLAATEKKVAGKKIRDPDETVGTLFSWDGQIDFTIEHQIGGQWKWDTILDEIIKTGRLDGPMVTIVIEEEPGAGGINQVEAIKKYVLEKLGPAWTVESHKPSGDKVQRATPWFGEAKFGRIWIVYGDWNEDFLDQLDNFPEYIHDDRIDSVSGARQFIAPYKTWKKIEFIHL